MIRHDKIASYGTQENTGFIDFITWNNLKWRRPDKAGLYYTSDSNGNVSKLYMSTSEKPICNVIFPMDAMADAPIWSNGEEITNDDIINICNAESVWYDFEVVEEYGEYFGSRVIIITKEDLPVYWADFNKLVGPTEYDRKHSPIHIEP